MKNGLLILCLALAVLHAPAKLAAVDAAKDPVVEGQRTAYRAARAAITRGTPGAMRVAEATLRAYPLYPYLLHADLKRRIRQVSEAEADAFLTRWEAIPITPLFRSRWSRELARRGAWTTFLSTYDPSATAVDLRCHALTAALRTGGDAPLDERTVDLWLHGESRPEACDPVFTQWRSTGALTSGLVLDRVRLSVLAGEQDLASWLARRLRGAERAVADQWIAAGARPERALAQIEQWPERAKRDDFVAPLLRKLARSNIDAVYRVWSRARNVLSAAEMGAVERDLAILRATDYGPDAVARLLALPREHVDQRVLAWRTRVAIARGAWGTVRRSIDAMEANERADSRWQYWLARADAELGNHVDAERRYASLAQKANYHGFLAADRIGQPYALCPDLSPAPAVDLSGNAGIVRALELHAVGQTVDARREWRIAIDDLNEQGRMAAALLAAAEGWHHQAILDFAGLGRLNRYEERFPVPWSQVVASGAKRQSLPPSLIYAVMRAESALAPDAHSGAGARGLMQLLPTTARSMAQSAGISAPSRSRLFDPETNIRLGSAYLRKLADEYQHPLLALAAYNAGPRPLARWDASGRLPIEPDRWIETLPYYETREYVPRVLTFQVLYEWQITGRMTRLERMMAPLNRARAWPARWDVGSFEPVCPADRAVAGVGGGE